MKYEEYLEKKDAITLQEANKILLKIQESIDTTDEDAQEIYNDFLEGALLYASVRSGWLSLSKEEKMDQDKGRTSSMIQL